MPRESIQGGLISTPTKGEAFARLRDLVLREGGLDLYQYRERWVERRLAVRQRALGTRTLGAYLEALQADPGELPSLLDVLTVNVSEFFRNPQAFRIIAEYALPDILARKRGQGVSALRLWSVGCASGEEPYSLAILLRESLRETIAEYSVLIYATDVDRKSLERAKEGFYPQAKLAQVPEALRRKYFRPEGRGLRVRDEVKGMVIFREHNFFLEEPTFSRLDLVTFRNVMIYLTPSVQRQALDIFYQILNPGGYLVLGRVEGLQGAARELFEPVSISERIYRKPL
ncbi:MAG: protein-glutamate O-methyltransferase CheR [candidate division NC10 bacterium]|nr:protein-glutamate O-methyltransferase CheR [candidate division NC10 bacterium]